MTQTGRLIVAVAALLSGVALAIVGVIVKDHGALTAGVGLAGPVVGYVLGDRNGEKRLASALTILEAEQRTASHTRRKDDGP